ncbi:putative ATP-dependent serine protease [Brucella pseudogrignonensis]|uniref:ATP-dependent serine protease n=1 Tax=Brucella pseudogrignonensis TaxID=419475 RepID=A0ABU1M5A7_9HYPH|nr:putative ATP-dependent serine protease [Brucella pseudogrignonensis]
MAKREVLFFCSYCGDDDPACTDQAPCADCLAMCNVYEVEFEGAVYKRELAPRRESATEWQQKLTRLLMPLSGKRPLSRSRFNALAKLAGATFLLGRRNNG